MKSSPQLKLWIIGFVLTCAIAWTAHSQTTTLTYAQAPVDNPLKGFVPYVDGVVETNGVPFSMSYENLSLRELMTGPTNFDWAPLEALIHEATNNGCQFIFRVQIDSGKLPTSIPQYLLNGGLTTNGYSNSGVPAISPNWENTNLRMAMTNFIAALGAKYDGDPRIGFIEEGLLGTWGEWNDDITQIPWASTNVQAEVMNAFQSAFHTTKLLVRNPYSDASGQTGGPPPKYFSGNNLLSVGYHDDAFCAQTMDYFMGRMTNATALNKWQTQPIGGEVYPDYWYCVFSNVTCAPVGQDFTTCANATHASWMLYSGLYEWSLIDSVSQSNALAGAHLLGYEFYVPSFSVLMTNGIIRVSVQVTNTGIAPFYYNWPLQLAAFTNGAIAQTWPTQWALSGILPGQSTNFQIALTNRPSTSFTLLLRAVNPLPGGKVLRFANAAQDTTTNGWLSLGTVLLAPLPPSDFHILPGS